MLSLQGWAPVGAAELGGVLPAHCIGLARLPRRDALSDRPLAVSELGDALTRSHIHEHVKPVFDDALEAAPPSEAVRFLPGHDRWVIGPGTKDVQVTPSSRRDPATRKANQCLSVVSCAGLGRERATS